MAAIEIPIRYYKDHPEVYDYGYEDMELKFEQCAFLVVDVDGTAPNPTTENFIAPALAAAREVGMLVCYVHNDLRLVADPGNIVGEVWGRTKSAHGGNGIAGGVGESYRQDFTLDGFESTEGFALVESSFDDGSGSPNSAQNVFQAEQGVDDPAVQGAMEDMFAEVLEIDDVLSVQSPYAPEGAIQISSRGEAAGTIAYATVNLPDDIDFNRAADIGQEVR